MKIESEEDQLFSALFCFSILFILVSTDSHYLNSTKFDLDLSL